MAVDAAASCAAAVQLAWGMSAGRCTLAGCRARVDWRRVPGCCTTAGCCAVVLAFHAAAAAVVDDTAVAETRVRPDAVAVAVELIAAAAVAAAAQYALAPARARALALPFSLCGAPWPSCRLSRQSY